MILSMLHGCLCLELLPFKCSTVLLLSMMFCCMVVKPVESVDCIEMRKTDCFGKTRLVLHVPSSS